MKKRTIALISLALALAVSATLVFALRHRILEAWYLAELRKGDAATERGAVWYLSELGSKEAVPLIAEILSRSTRDEYGSPPIWVVRALAKIEPEGIDALYAAARLDREDSPDWLFYSLENLGPEGAALAPRLLDGIAQDLARETDDYEAGHGVLAAMGEAAWPAILAAAKGDASHRLAALSVLSSFADREYPLPLPPAAIPILVKALEDPEPSVRDQAVDALINDQLAGKATTAIPALVKLLDDPEVEGVASALAPMGSAARAALPALVRRIVHGREGPIYFTDEAKTDEEPEEEEEEEEEEFDREAAKEFEAWQENPLGGAKLPYDLEIDEEIVGALLSIDPGGHIAMPLLAERAGQTSDPVEKVAALRVLAEWPKVDADTLARVQKFLDDPREVIRGTAICTLGEFGNSAAPTRTALVRLARNSDGLTHALAAISSVRVGVREEDVLKTLNTAYQDLEELRPRCILAFEVLAPTQPEYADRLALAAPDSDDAVAAIVRLGKLPASATRILAESLNSENPDSLERSIQCLTALGTGAASAMPALVRLLSTKSALVSDRAMQCIVNLGLRASTIPPQLVSELSAVSHGGCVPRSGDTSYWLLESMGPAALPALIDGLSLTQRDTRYNCLRLIANIGKRDARLTAAILPVLKDEHENARAIAASVLGTLGDATPAVEKAIQPLLSDDDPDVRAPAAIALWQINGHVEPAIEILRKLLEPDEYGEVETCALWSIVDLGPAASPLVPRLIEILASPYDEYQLSAARALKAIGPGASEALPALEEAARDATWKNRKTYAEVITAIRGRQ